MLVYKMLIHSSKLLKNQNTLHLRRLLNHSESKVTNNRIKPTLKTIEQVQEKFKHVTNAAITKCNEVIGFKEIDQAYDKISGLQESLQAIQNERTLLQIQISNIRSDITNIQTEIHEHKRGDRQYLELMKKEFEAIQHKNQLEEHYSILDRKERELFTHLQAKINMLHEKSKSHTRQWGIISTIIGATLGIIGTSISAYYRNNDIRNIQRSNQTQMQEQIEPIMQAQNQLEKRLIEHFERFKETLNKSSGDAQKPRNNESWAGYFKRKTVSAWRWCTFQQRR